MDAGREEVRMKLNPESLARASSRHPWRTLGIWVVLIGTMGFVSSQLLGDVLTQDIEFTNEPESVRAQEVLDERFSDGAETASTEFFIVQSDTLSVDDPRFAGAVRGLQAEIAEVDGDILASDPFTYYDLAEQAPEQAAGLVSRDGRGTLIGVPLTDVELSTIEELRAVAREARPEGFTVQVAGQGVMFADFTEIAEEDLRRGESIGIAAALIIMIVVFAAVVAAIVPIVMAIFAIVVALGLVSLIGQMAEFNLFVTNMVSMIGLAAGAILVTLASLAASMTLLPAILGLLGDRVNWPRLAKRARVDSDHDPRGGFWDRITRGVMARPVVYLLLAVAVLGGLGSFYFQLNRGTSQSVSTLPDDFESKQAFLTLEREFAGGLTDPARIIVTGEVDSPEAQAAIGDLQATVAGMEVFAPETQVIPSEDGTAVEVDAFFRGDPSTNAAFQAIRDLRSVRRSDHVFPGGVRDPFLQLDRVPVPAGLGHRGLAAAVPVLRPVRPVDGLPRVPPVPDPGGVRQDPRQHRGRGVRPADHGRDHHRGRSDHGGGVHRVRGRPTGAPPADGLRAGRGGVHGRHDRAEPPGAGLDAAARRLELVPAQVAELAPPGQGGGPRAHDGRAGARAGIGGTVGAGGAWIHSPSRRRSVR